MSRRSCVGVRDGLAEPDLFDQARALDVGHDHRAPSPRRTRVDQRLVEEDVDESMLVVPMRYDGATIGVITLSKLGLGGFDDGRPAAPDDPRRPGGDRRRVGPPADPHARTWPASCAACST